eukprot:1186376-Prorocentrum_minimum.AAC.3
MARRGVVRGPRGKYRSSVVSLVSLRTRLKAKNTRGVFNVCCTRICFPPHVLVNRGRHPPAGP